MRTRRDEEDDPMIYGDPIAPFYAQHWYSGQGDPLYALGSTGWPKPLSDVEWMLRNARASLKSFDAGMRKKYKKKPYEKWDKGDKEAADEISQLVWALNEAVHHKWTREEDVRS